MIARDINISIEVVKLETTEVTSFRPVCRSRSEFIMYVLSSTCVRSLFSSPLPPCLKPSFENMRAKLKKVSAIFKSFCHLHKGELPKCY